MHDIGKNLVDIILLEQRVDRSASASKTITEIINAWQETQADVIGMSGLLVKSVMVMEENLKQMNELEERPPVILGGAALSRHYCESHLLDLRGQAVLREGRLRWPARAT